MVRRVIKFRADLNGVRLRGRPQRRWIDSVKRALNERYVDRAAKQTGSSPGGAAVGGPFSSGIQRG